MAGVVLGLIIIFALVAITLYLYAHFFPGLSKLWLALLIVSIVLGAIRALHAWMCNLLCA